MASDQANDVVEQLRAITADPDTLLLACGLDPEIPCTLHEIRGSDPRCDVLIAFEVAVFEQSAGYSPEFLTQTFNAYNPTSIFFALIDQTLPDSPSLVGILRVIDCSAGPSESADFYREVFGDDVPLPPDLDVSRTDNLVWDVMTVAARQDARSGLASAWLYHALYLRSVEEAVDRYISNMSTNEARNLIELVGIPFTEIPGASPATDPALRTAEASYRFYHCEIAPIRKALTQRLALLQKESEEDMDAGGSLSAYMARIIRIALDGEDSPANRSHPTHS